MRAVAGILSLMVLCHAASAWPDDEARLRKDLFHGYDKTVRPENNTVIKFTGPSILDVKVDDKINAIELYGWFNLEWSDPRLQWNKSDYADITSISVPDGFLWIPDLTVYNAHSVEDIWIVSPQPQVVFDSGKVLWVPPTKAKAICVTDLTMWPRDTHSCNLTVGSWTQSGIMVDLQIQGQPEFKYLIGYTPNITASSWEILGAETTRQETIYDCCPEVYVSLVLNLKVRRYAPNITPTVFVPAVCLSLLTLFVFLLHPKSGEKINLGGFCLVLDLIFLIYIATLVGFSRPTTPILVKLAVQQLVMATIGVLASALVLRLARNPRSSGIPTCFRRPLSLIAKGLFLGNYSEVLNNDPSYTTKDETKKTEFDHPPHYSQLSDPAEKNSGDDYLVLAAVTDRILFLLFLAVCVNNIAHFWCVM